MNDHWSVTVTRNGEDLITIESNSLCGKAELTEEDEDTILNAAQHLLAFVGEPRSEVASMDGMPF